MIAIIAEKPSVALDIAKVVGARKKRRGYLEGNGYKVTWALGHLLTLAMPRDYGYTRITSADLPIFPNPFKLIVRRAPGKDTPDPDAVRQLNIIDSVFTSCSSIIVATDAGREGELIFRYIYAHLGYTKPFKRLWISSLTDRAIREGLANLRPGSDYDGLYAAADCRAKADWLVGINASRALSVASGLGNNSLGRVQTPTLAMVCARYREHKAFVPSDYWQLRITLRQGEDFRQFRHEEDFSNQAKARELLARIGPASEATIGVVERKRSLEAPPLLYDLTALQKVCSDRLELAADETLEIAQRLYEQKLISYPRTGSRHIPEDVMEEIPALLKALLLLPEYSAYTTIFSDGELSRRSVDTGKVTDHHALLTTGEVPVNLTSTERSVYQMIAHRMLEAFAPPCQKEMLLMEATTEGLLFRSRSQRIIAPGWRALSPQAEDENPDREERGSAEFTSGEVVPVSGTNLRKAHTMPPPLFTEATLLTAMETAGAQVADPEAREAMKELGLGTPATRASILLTLFRREYIERIGKSIVPTEKGLYIYDRTREMRIADAALTGGWEKALCMIRLGELKAGSFMESIAIYARQVTEEVISIRFPDVGAGTLPCPKCHAGKIILRRRFAQCTNPECAHIVPRRFLNMDLTDSHFEQLFTTGATELIRRLKDKDGQSFDAFLSFAADCSLRLVFPEDPLPSGKKQ